MISNVISPEFPVWNVVRLLVWSENQYDLLPSDVEIWTDRFRNLGDGNQKAGAERIAKVLIEVYRVARGIPRGIV